MFFLSVKEKYPEAHKLNTCTGTVGSVVSNDIALLIRSIVSFEGDSSPDTF